jgi:hypothetical protein
MALAASGSALRRCLITIASILSSGALADWIAGLGPLKPGVDAGGYLGAELLTSKSCEIGMGGSDGILRAGKCCQEPLREGLA